jgi:hypothetical protein
MKSDKIITVEQYYEDKIRAKKERSRLYEFKEEILHLRKLGTSFDDIVLYLEEEKGYQTTKRSVHFFLGRASPEEFEKRLQRKARRDARKRSGVAGDGGNQLSTTDNYATASVNHMENTIDRNKGSLNTGTFGESGTMAYTSGGGCGSDGSVSSVAKSRNQPSSDISRVQPTDNMSMGASQPSNSIPAITPQLLQAYKREFEKAKVVEKMFLTAYAK